MKMVEEDENGEIFLYSCIGAYVHVEVISIFGLRR